MRILVTGVAGFIGSHLASYLLETTKHEIFGVDDLSGGFTRNVPDKCKFTRLDLRNKDAIRIYIKEVKPELIYHLVADATEGRSQFTPINCTERNYLAYLNLLVPAINNKLRKIVLTSSMSVYGAQKPPFSEDLNLEPEDIYAVSKVAMEKSTKILAKVHNFDYTIIRPHNVYGPRQNLSDPYRNVVAIFINCLLRGKNFYIYGDGEQKRAFTYIDDFTPYIVKAGFLEKTNGETINIGPTKEDSVNNLATYVLRAFGYNKDNIPEKLKPKYLPDRPQEVKEAYCTDKKARKLLGFNSKTSLEEGVKKMVLWAKEIGPQEPRYMDSLEIETEKTPSTWKKKLI